MKRIFTIFLALCVMLSSTAVYAQPVEAIPPGDDVIVAIKKGVQAPFDGQLFSSETALRWANWLKQFRARLELDVKRANDVCEVEKGYRDSLLVIERERAASVERDLQDRLKASEAARLRAEEAMRDPAFYKTPEFGVIIGVVATAAVFALSVWAIDSAVAE